MRVWANRMSPILAKWIGHHQRGFIPTRDGRENILNVQLLIDSINTKDKWWADKVWAGDTSQSHADKAMTKMRAEAAEAKVVLIEWTTPECISPDTKEARVLFPGPCTPHLPT